MPENDNERDATTSATHDVPSRVPEDLDLGTPSTALRVSAYHFAIIVLAVGGTLLFEKHFGIDSQDLIKQAYGLIFGALGGTFAASRYVILSVRHNAYERRRLLWQVLTPVYSAVLGWVGVIALGGGILILASSPKPSEPQFTFFTMGFSFLIGFASESFSKRLIMAAQTLFGEHAGMEEIVGGRSDDQQSKASSERTGESK